MPNHELKLVKTVEIPQPLEDNHDYVIAGKFSVTDINRHNEDNGDYTYTYKGQLIAVEVVNKQGRTFKGVAKGSMSQVMRAKIINKYSADAYEGVMKALLENFDEITEKYIE